MRFRMMVVAMVVFSVMGAPAVANAGPVGEFLCANTSSGCTVYTNLNRRILCPLSGWTCNL